MASPRDFLRINPSTRLHCKALDEDPVVSGEASTLLLNIAGGGISFAHDEAHAQGTPLALDMEVPGLPSRILAFARVVSCDVPATRAGGYEIAAELYWVGWAEPEAQRRVAERLRASLTA